jgi:hypothetical protein
MRVSNKEDLATTEQVKVVLTHRQYHYHKYLSLLTPKKKESNPHPKRRGKPAEAENYSWITVMVACSL